MKTEVKKREMENEERERYLFGVKKKRSFLSWTFVLLVLALASVAALVAIGGDFYIEKFFSGISGGKVSGGDYEARFFQGNQPVGSASGGNFTASVGPLSSSAAAQNYDFTLIQPTNQIVSNVTSAVYTITLNNIGLTSDSYTISVSNDNNADSVLLNTSSINNLGAGGSAQFTLTVGSSLAGNYTTNVGVVSQGNSSVSRSVSITTTVTLLPIISSYEISPYAVVNGSSVRIYISALSTERIYARVIKPDTNIEIINLTNNANITFSNSSLIGRYNITLFANNSQGTVNISDYFESFMPVQFNFNVVNFNTTGVSSSWEIRYRDQVINSNDSSLGNHSSILPGSVVSLNIKSHSNRLQVTLREINVSSESGKSFGMDKLSTPVSGYLLTYGINNSYNFTNANVRVYYNDVLFTNENNLRIDRCDSWDFVSRTCASGFSDISSSATQNKTGNYFEYLTTSFSGFGIRELASIPLVEATSNVAGGGCLTEWNCGAWGECSGGLQTRTCSPEKSYCYANPAKKPAETQECMPERLFDIFLELEETTIKISSDLVARVRFESFGSVPTPVDLTYVILDALGNEVYIEKGEIIVETEAVLTKRFDAISLSDGGYTLVLTTIYGDNVEDQFKQEFEVRSERLSLLKIILIAVSVLVIILIVVIYIIYRKRELWR